MLLFFPSCYSQNEIVYNTNGTYNITSTTSFLPLYFSLLRDYDENAKILSENEILSLIRDNTEDTLKLYGLSADVKVQNGGFSISVNTTKENITAVILKITSDISNPILYYEGEQLRLNINKDNYMDLKAFLPILENETFYSYTARFNEDTTEEEYLELIGYVLSENASASLKECKISINLKDESSVHNLSFTLLDFLLLHTPLTL